MLRKYTPYAIIGLLLMIILYNCNRKEKGTTTNGSISIKTDTVTVVKTKVIPGPVVKEYVYLPAPAAPKSSRPANGFVANKINTYIDTANFTNAKVITRSEVQGVLLDKRVELQMRQDTIIREKFTTVTNTITQTGKPKIRLYATVAGGLNDLGPGATVTTPRNLLYQYHYNVLQNQHQIGIGKVISFKKRN